MQTLTQLMYIQTNLSLTSQLIHSVLNHIYCIITLNSVFISLTLTPSLHSASLKPPISCLLKVKTLLCENGVIIAAKEHYSLFPNYTALLVNNSGLKITHLSVTGFMMYYHII